MTHNVRLDVPSSIALLVDQVGGAGGKAHLVGGAVIDVLQGREVKDWDLEVHGMTYGALEGLFAKYKPKLVGKSFGVMKLSIDGLSVDVNVPRRDNHYGVGHKKFKAELDPFMSVTEAARRRDFTINAMALDLSTNELHDPFGGMLDLNDGLLRATDPVLFVQDPLRGLRAMQLLARKASRVHPPTKRLIRGMRAHFNEPKDRIFMEFEKLLLRAEQPSVGLEFLREVEWLSMFPELEALIGVEQRHEWHPEGDVWTHTLRVVDGAAEVRHLVPEYVESEETGKVPQRLGFMFGCLCHDLGKPATTITQEMIDRRDPVAVEKANKANKALQDMLLTAHGHPEEGVEPTEAFMRRMTDEKKLIKLTLGIVEKHLNPNHLLNGNAGKGAYARLHHKMQAIGGDLRLLGRVSQADGRGCGMDRSLTNGEPNWDHETSRRCFEWADKFEEDDSAVKPLVMGRDLIAAGLKPGVHFKGLLERALALQDSDPSLSKDDILAQLINT